MTPSLRSHLTSTLPLLVVSAVNLVSLFAVYWLVLTKLGNGGASDALFAAFTIPQFVLSVTQTALGHVLIPVLSTSTEDDRRRDGWTFFQAALLVFGALAILLFLTSSVWVRWLAPGFSPETLEVTRALVHIQLITMVLTALRAVAAAIFHANGRFLMSEASESVAGVLSVVFLVVYIDELGVYAAAWCLALRYGIAVLLMVPAFGRYSRPKLGNANVVTAYKRAWPLLAGSSYTRLDMVVDRFLASLAAPGLLSLLSVAQQIFGAGNLLIHKTGSAPAFPRLSQLAAAGDWAGLKRLYRARLAGNAGLSLLAIAAVVVIGRPFLDVVFRGEQFDAASVETLWHLLLALFGLLIGGSMGQMASMAFYSIGDTRTPVVVGVIGFTIGIGMKMAGYFYFGVLGIAFATSLYYLLTLLIMERLFASRLARELGSR